VLTALLKQQIRKNSLKNAISTSTVTPEMLERVHGNACLDANGKILKIYFNKIDFVEVFGCCVTSQTHQNGCLGQKFVPVIYLNTRK
jgi:hypothetical protein